MTIDDQGDLDGLHRSRKWERDDMRDYLYERYVSAFKGAGMPASGVACPTPSQRRSVAFYFLSRLKGTAKQAAILDLGCGDGVLLQCLRDEGFLDVYGVDYCEEQVAIALRRGISATHSDLFAFLERSDRKYDVIFAIDVLEHLKKNELLAFGDLVRKSLAENGMIVVQVPNGEGLFSGHVIYGDLTHQTIFNSSSLRQFFQAFGFSEIVIAPTGPIPWTLSGGIRWVVWQLVAFAAKIATLAESGRRPSALTQTVICTARLRGESVSKAESYSRP
jgi:2-polyprenyl-3-methyl-5-hydroxy-6-metoxy-1,4-benzoquinol methylase